MPREHMPDIRARCKRRKHHHMSAGCIVAATADIVRDYKLVEPEVKGQLELDADSQSEDLF